RSVGAGKSDTGDFGQAGSELIEDDFDSIWNKL
ncbi:MAG: hypothetical protein ACI81F_002277, partial [Thalassolituus oleivorans]